ncbi:MAG: ATP-dependent DNA helicase UvrD2 [Actinomycetota bacterium]|nr:ATP-dependent DNA helicase UvrD2 [Actinomycetota bacterium]
MRLLDGLDSSQREAVVSEAAPLCILAGAGSGKTRVLTSRIAHRVTAQSAEASRTLVLTFTRKAAGELRSRLRSLGVRDQVAAGTFHGIAYTQLRRRWADRGEPAPTLLDSKVRLLAPLVRRAQAESRSPALVQVADLATEIEWAKARLVPPSGYEAAADFSGRRLHFSFATMAGIYQHYEDDKRRKRMVDFDDLLAGCIHALETDPEFAAGQRWRFRHFFVDEFQDVNPAQFRLLRAWLGDRPDLCVVGDPNQAIYAWNGADPLLLTEFRRHFAGAEVLHLDHNHRSTPQVVSVAAAVLGASQVEPRATRPDGPLPVVRRFETDEAEARGIARILRRAHGPGTGWSRMAVLARTNAQLVLLEEHLRAAGVPARHTGDGSLLLQAEVKAALEHMRRSTSGSPFTSRLSDVEAMALDTGSAQPGDEAGNDERRLSLQILVRLGRDYAALDLAGSVDGFVAWLRAGGRCEGPQQGADAVELTTFHRAKGLEWPVVVVAGLENGLVPIGRTRTPEAEDEERRLLHVALTRALDEVHCTWAERRTFASRTVARSPSPYLAVVEAAIAAMAPGDAGPVAIPPRLRAQRDELRERRHRSSSAEAGCGDSEAARSALDALRAWRSATARASGVPAFVIFHDATLGALAEARPSTRAELMALPGLGAVKAERYGDTLLALLASGD